MAMLVLSNWLEEEIRADRVSRGIDVRDECWDGVYVVSPDPNNQHQSLVSRLTHAFEASIGDDGHGLVFPGANISDRDRDWLRNYRVPDVAVFLNDNPARNLDTHWLGGPDLAVEILSPGDRAREKLPFYAGVGTGEILVIDREPWQLELYRLEGGRLDLVGTSDLDHPEAITSEALPLAFRLMGGEDRPRIKVTHRDGRSWLA